MEQQQSSFKEKERTDLREPQHFKVIIYNDDFTTMEFVIYTYDIAQSKVQKATRMAREENFPLRLTIAPEEE